MDILSSTSNPFIKHIRALRQKKTRSEFGSFLVEGITHVGEAIQAGWEVEAVVYAPELLISSYAKDLLASAAHQQVRLQPVTVSVMESLADKENPQGILAVVKQKHATFSAISQEEACVCLVAPQDPGNVGTILRTIDAVGAGALIVLDGGVELFHPTVVRASMGTLFGVPIVQASFDEFALWAQAGSRQVIGTSAKASNYYRTFTPRQPWALLLGNEQKGLTARQLEACEVTLSLPMRGRVSSLNLSVAAGVLLYQFLGI